MLVDKEQYLEAGVNIGTRRNVKDMEEFIFRVKKNNLSILDIDKTDERIEQAANLLANYEPEDILLVSRKPTGHNAVVTFSDITGCNRIFGRFMPGTLTNPNSEEFREPEIVLVTDPEEDFLAVEESMKANIPSIAIADSSNSLDYIDHVVPANNNGTRSIALVYYLLAREYLQKRGEIDGDDDFNYTVDDFEAEEAEDDETDADGEQ
jgi:small subunit ribosomal protein S2